MQMGYSDASSRSSSRENENFLSGIGTEVIYLIPDSLALNVKDGYQNLVTFEDRALTDIDTNIVILNLPLDTPLKIYAYRFEDAYSLSDIDSVVRTPLSFGISGSFIITSATTSITVSLSITPNGEPGIQIKEPTTSINNLGGSGTFTIKLNTHPFHQVTIPVSVDNTSIATISTESVSFTPTNWSDTKTVTITGKTDVNYSDNTTLGVSIGPTSSDDGDYNQITETFTLATKSSPITPVNLIASAGDSFVSLDWDQVSNATGYNVYYDEMSGVTDNDSVITGITNDNYTFSGLLNNTTYYFRVASVNSNGISALSNEVSATPTSNDSSQTDNLSRGLVGFYKFDGDANDNTSNANHGTVNGPTLTTGKDNISNTAYSFDGVNDYISINDPFENSDNFSLSIWVNTEVFTGSYHGFLGKQGDNYRKPGMWLNVRSKGLHYDHYSTSGTRFSGTLSNFFSSTETWYHIVWVKSDNESKFFRDAELISTVTSPSKFYTKRSTPYWIGKIDNYWDGSIDNLRIYDRALKSSEISLLFTSDQTNSNNN